MATRRRVLAALAAAAACPAAAHTPYRQWVVYRQKHLLIGAHRGDARTYELAQRVVAVLAEELPAAKARIARGPRPQRIASLIGTGQLLLAVLSRPEAARMARALPPFEGYRPAALRPLAALADGYALYGSEDLPLDHAWLVTQALDHAKLGAAPGAEALAGESLPLHPGAEAFWAGAPLPE